MSTPVYYPSLSTNSWVTDDSMLADYLFSDFLLSDYSQSQLAKGQVASMSYIIQQNQGDVAGTMNKLKSVLESYFARYFTSVEVEVSDTTTDTTSSEVSLSIYLSFDGYDGTTKILGKVMQVVDSKITKVTNINNYGTT